MPTRRVRREPSRRGQALLVGSVAVAVAVSVIGFAGVSPAGAAFPGLNGRIVYIAAGSGYLSSMNADGTGVVTLRERARWRLSTGVVAGRGQDRVRRYSWSDLGDEFGWIWCSSADDGELADMVAG